MQNYKGLLGKRLSKIISITLFALKPKNNMTI